MGFTHVPRFPGRFFRGDRGARRLSISSTSRIRSSMRNRARPLPMTSKSSAPPTSVQPAGTDLRHPPSSWKYTRSPVQSWRCSKTSSSRPLHGWNGCVTRHRHTDPVGPGVVDSCFQDSSNQVRPSPAQSLLGRGARGRLELFGFFWRKIAGFGCSRALTSSSDDIRVVPIVEEQVAPGLWDLGDDAG